MMHIDIVQKNNDRTSKKDQAKGELLHIHCKESGSVNLGQFYNASNAADKKTFLYNEKADESIS
jgi:hypothetical protein